MTERPLPEYVRTEVDGIPTLWLDAGEGPFVAALSFRVGRADEPAPRSGISHIVEHLALARLGVQPYDHNGFVDATRTNFHSVGRPDDAVQFMGAVAGALADPPLDRLLLERRVLRSEHDQQGPSIGGAVRWFRWGYTGHGLIGEEELGLEWLGPDPVRDWIAGRFTRANAVLWLSGPPPADLRIPLPDGPAYGPPPNGPIPTLRFPLHHTWNGPGVTLAWLMPRQPESNMLINIAHRRARQRLRFDLGLIYDVSMDYDPLDADTAHVTLGADCPDERVAQVRDALLTVVDELASTGPTTEELAAEVTGFVRQFDDRDARIGFLDASVIDLLFRREPRTAEQIIEGRRLVTPDHAATTLRTSLESLLLLASGELLPGERFRRYPAYSTDEVAGKVYGPAGFFLPGRRPKDRLVAGPDGLTLRTGPTERITVRYRDCVAVGHPGPGLRDLWSADGFRIGVASESWKDGDEILRAVDAALAPELVACDEHGIGALADPTEEATA
jgi:hypothetical protein